jgi:hypothetical protein
MDKVLMPKEEWEDFRDNALRDQNPTTHNFLKMAFIGGLTSATDFFQNLISGDLDSDVKQDLFERWLAGLTIEVEAYKKELWLLMGEDNGRTH